MRIRADKRQIEAEPAPEAEARLRANVARLLALEVEIAKDLAEVDTKAAFILQSCASIQEYASRLGYDPGRALDLCSLGHAMGKTPGFEAQVISGTIPMQCACVASRILAHPDLIRAGEDWVGRACTWKLRDIRRAVRVRIEEGRQLEAGLAEVSVLVTVQTQTDFERCRTLASQQAGKELSQSQTFARVVDHYLDSHDPARAKTGTRRVGPTQDRPADRYVPQEVLRALAARSGGECEVPGCDRVAQQTAHIHGHAGHHVGQGSGREVTDLWDACYKHHVLYDAGLLRFLGFGEDGKPRFGTANGEPITARPDLPQSGAPQSGAPPSGPPRAPPTEEGPPEAGPGKAPAEPEDRGRSDTGDATGAGDAAGAADAIGEGWAVWNGRRFRLHPGFRTG